MRDDTQKCLFLCSLQGTQGIQTTKSQDNKFKQKNACLVIIPQFATKLIAEHSNIVCILETISKLVICMSSGIPESILLHYSIAFVIGRAVATAILFKEPLLWVGLGPPSINSSSPLVQTESQHTAWPEGQTASPTLFSLQLWVFFICVVSQ